MHLYAAWKIGNRRSDCCRSISWVQKPWIDEKRIGIWGWSYGGYMTLLCLTKGSDVFHMGIAVAPVTNWRFYDNIYTERFMQRPQDNPNGYDDNSPIHYADRLKGKLLIDSWHGR